MTYYENLDANNMYFSKLLLVKDTCVKAFILQRKTVSLFPFIVQLPVFIVSLQQADRIPHLVKLYT